MTDFNRRHFLTATGAIGLLGSSAMLNSLSATAGAADTSGYKALVCVFLKGGMDHADTVLPYDQESYDALAGIRQNLFSAYNVGSGSSSRDRENLLELIPDNASDFGGRRFALPQELAPIKDLFDAGNAAIIGNVGPLIEPTTRTTMDNFTSTLPKRLFSHNDQQSTWMSQGTEGAQYGWGGRFADAAMGSDVSSNSSFASIATSGNDVFLSGEIVRPFSAPVGSISNINYLTKRWYLGSGYNSDAARQTMKEHFGNRDIPSDNSFVRDHMNYNGRAIDNLDTFIPAIESAPEFASTIPSSSLGKQLNVVARTIAVNSSLNVSRQVFYVAIGGFDSHSGQAQSLPNLHSQIAQAVSAFYSALGEIGMQNNVTLFTASDFGRTTVDNGDGTDHGWGAHHFVVGNAVQGRRIYGTMPEMDLGLESYTQSRGRLIPSVSVDQYAATLGSWFGLSDSELNDALPNLQNFATSNVGFV